jgi:hypothetical protein
VNGICGCGLPACFCQPAVAGGFIYADLWGELSTHLAPQSVSHCYKLSLSKHTGGGDTEPTFSGQCVYLQFTWEVGLLPSPVEFSSHCCFYKLSCSWLLGMCCHSCVLWWLVYLQFCEGFPLPPTSVLRASRPLCYMSFLLLLLILKFLFFSLGGGWSVLGAMLIWPRVVCGGTMCRLAHLWSASSQAIWMLASGSSPAKMFLHSKGNK